MPVTNAARVGEIEIVHARRDAGARQAVVLRLIGSRGVDQHVELLAFEVIDADLGTVQGRGDSLRRTFAPRRAANASALPRDRPAIVSSMLRHARQTLGHPSAEGSIAAEHEHPLHAASLDLGWQGRCRWHGQR